MRVITLNIGNEIIGVKNVGEGYELKENEIVSIQGELGQIMQPDGTFIDTSQETPPQPTLEDKVNFLYYKSKGLI